jgi:hypothetical protein
MPLLFADRFRIKLNREIKLEPIGLLSRRVSIFERQYYKKQLGFPSRESTHKLENGCNPPSSKALDQVVSVGSHSLFPSSKEIIHGRFSQIFSR